MTWSYAHIAGADIDSSVGAILASLGEIMVCAVWIGYDSYQLRRASADTLTPILCAQDHGQGWRVFAAGLDLSARWAFGPVGERVLHVRAFQDGANDALPGLSPLPDIGIVDASATRFVLRGSRVEGAPGEWYEAEIPEPIAYPIAHESERACLSALAVRDDSGQVIDWVWRNIEPLPT